MATLNEIIRLPISVKVTTLQRDNKGRERIHEVPSRSNREAQ